MGAFNRVRFEALAKGVAGGASIRAAGIAAGWGRNTRTYYRYAERPDFPDAVERWKLELRRGGSSDLGPVISDLMEGAQKAIALGSGAGMAAACKMLTEAGRLKQLLANAEREAAEDDGPPDWAAP
ncbi:MAG: hypothetical protein ABSD80_10600, partial [Caulobacteraceae bacterium]